MQIFAISKTSKNVLVIVILPKELQPTSLTTAGKSNQIKIKSNYFIVRLKVDQRAGQLNLPHLGITKTEKIELKHKTDEQISPVNSLEPWDQSDRQKQTKVEDKILWKGSFWAQSEKVMEGDSSYV